MRESGSGEVGATRQCAHLLDRIANRRCSDEVLVRCCTGSFCVMSGPESISPNGKKPGGNGRRQGDGVVKLFIKKKLRWKVLLRLEALHGFAIHIPWGCVC